MRFKRILGIAAAVATGLGYLYLHSNSPESANVKQGGTKPPSQSSSALANPFGSGPASTTLSAEATTSTKPAIPVRNLSYDSHSFKAAALPERLIAMSARRNGRSFDPQQVADALKSDIVWEADSTAADKLPISDAERKDGREFVHLNPMKIEALMAGDEMNLPVKQIKTDTPLRMVVDEVEPGIGGNITWHGHLKDFDKENQVSLTRGDKLIVGGISTPDKNYVVQIYGDVGWIVNGFTIFKGRHDAIKPD